MEPVVTVRLYIVWGDVRGQDTWDAIAADLEDHEASLRLSSDRAWAEVLVGPTWVSGPVAYLGDAGDADTREVVVVAGDHSPEWLSARLVDHWGWRRSYVLPRLTRKPFLCDVMLLARNWANQFDGWSTLLWLESTLLPLSRVKISLAGQVHSPVEPLEVCVLEVGNAADGVPFAVVLCNDPVALERQDLLSRGWRAEPRSRVQRTTWRQLASLADDVTVRSVSLLGHAIISDVIIKPGTELSSEVMGLLPADVQDAIRYEAAHEE